MLKLNLKKKKKKKTERKRTLKIFGARSVNPHLGRGIERKIDVGAIQPVLVTTQGRSTRQYRGDGA